MGKELAEQFQGRNPLFLGVLKGSFVFMADLVRACPVVSDLEFIAVSSYQNATVSSGRQILLAGTLPPSSHVKFNFTSNDFL